AYPSKEMRILQSSGEVSTSFLNYFEDISVSPYRPAQNTHNLIIKPTSLPFNRHRETHLGTDSLQD
ncbi:MAG: hypothetical protein KA296_09005, partial [Marinobacter sp.]|nr:hypothetical protein [Marinobacter sp.]